MFHDDGTFGLRRAVELIGGWCMNSIQTPTELLAVAGESLETYGQRVAGYFREHQEHTQAVIRMLTEALAEISGPSIAGTRLVQAAKEVDGAVELEHVRALRANFESCLAALRRNVSESATASEGQSPGSGVWETQRGSGAFIAVFRLQRADLIASRFGRAVLREMLDVVNTNVKQVLTAGDRVERWRDLALVAFIASNAGLFSVRGQFSKVVSNVRLQHINVGNRSALLSIGLDWTVLPHSGPRHPLPADVEAFLAGDTQRVSWSGA